MSKRDLVERWFVEAWEKGNMAILDEMLAPSLTDSDLLDGLLAPRRDFPLLVEVIHKLVGPLKVEILRFLQDGDWTSTHYIMTSPGPDAATPLRVEGVVLIRFEEDKIAELISRFDGFTLFEQLGQLPPDALVACLSGQKLTWA
ncbi:nuclear transport factor 2 family protein [Pseudophaeobacter sp.]|uniref:ester cyclase n=1 Tax=Pseudophaeobacter sp. TaxID=1971739 RepID=UPI00329A397C